VVGAGQSATLLRLEGFGPSVVERIAGIAHLAGSPATPAIADDAPSAAIWREIRDVAPLIGAVPTIWRLSPSPSDAADTVAAIGRLWPVEAFYDWGGGLVWLAFDDTPDAGRLRSLLPSGHATRMRAPAADRATGETFHPQPAALQALARRVKLAFDPAFILAPRRMAFEA
jgi:glycolate oxidase FAD binding subunit